MNTTHTAFKQLKQADTLLKVIKKRRSIYELGKKTPLSYPEIAKLIGDVIFETPSAFNSQTARIVLLFEESYHLFWDLALEEIKKVAPPEQFSKTQEKIASFKKGIGCILFFEDEASVAKLQEKFPLYKDKFPLWSEQSSAICQYAVWLMLSKINLGANLQHYNPIIDEKIKTTFHIPKSWRLNAQMNFGSIQKQADEKSYISLEERVRIYV